MWYKLPRSLSFTGTCYWTDITRDGQGKVASRLVWLAQAPHNTLVIIHGHQLFGPLLRCSPLHMHLYTPSRYTHNWVMTLRCTDTHTHTHTHNHTLSLAWFATCSNWSITRAIRSFGVPLMASLFLPYSLAFWAWIHIERYVPYNRSMLKLCTPWALQLINA